MRLVSVIPVNSLGMRVWKTTGRVKSRGRFATHEESVLYETDTLF